MSQTRADFSRKARLWLYPEGTRLQDLLLPLVTAVMTLVAAGVGWSLVQSQKQDAALINIAGRQRLLLLRHLRENEPQSGGALDRFSATARAVRDGGLVDGMGPGEGSRIQSHSDPFIRQKMDEQLRLAESLRKAGADPVQSRELVEAGVRSADETVRQFVSRSQEKTRELLWLILGTTGLLSLLGLFLARLIVERRIRLEQLLVARDAALKASHAKTHFLANMSHEIRTPLNAIIGMTEILESTELSGEQGRFVQVLRRAGDTLLSLINDVLDLSKIESGQVELHRREVAFAEFCDRIVEIVALRAHQKGLELTSYIAPGIPAALLLDETRVRQVLINLLGNAVKFTSAGEVALRIELEKKEGEDILLRVSVSDTGIGIPESKFAAIFEDFSQVDPSIAVNYGGTGLGLAISRRLVELMGGRIWVKSQPGAGSTFTFTLPARAVEKAKTASTSDEASLRGSLSGRRALVVDDNATNRLIVRRYLEEQAITVEEVASGAEAIEVLDRASRQRRPFDVIFMDFRMPGLSGVDVAARLRNRRLAEGAIVLLLTSDGRRNDLGNLNEIGITDFMVKPVRRAELLEATARALSGKSAPAAVEEPASPGTHGFPGKRIMVVDDVEDNRFIAQTYLAALGCEIETASSGEEAIEKARDGGFDLIFMDMRMAPMDGYESTRRIRAQEAARGAVRRPIVALTAHAMKEEIDRALEAGCDLHVTKPITREKLVQSLQKFFQAIPRPEVRKRTAPKAENPSPTGALKLELDDFLKPRLAGYLASVRAKVESISGLLDAGNFPEIAKSGHNISGTAGIYGMSALGQLAHELELSALKNDREAVASLNQRIEDYLARVVY